MSLFAELTALFVAASLVLYVFRYLDHPAIPGYIVAGLGIAPLIQGEALLDFARVGIVFLVFTFGLKFDPEEVADVASSTLTTTAVQIAVTGGLGILAGWLVGLTGYEAVVLGAVCALSSTLVGLDLAEQEVHRDLVHGRLAESIHLIQDIVGLGVLAALTSASFTAGVQAVLVGAVMIGAALLVRRYVFVYLDVALRFNTEILMLLGFSVLIGAVGLSSYLGVPVVVGAFAAGLSAAKFPYNMELLDTLGSVKDFFAAVFFTTLGALVGVPGWIAVAVALTVFVTAVVVKPFVASAALQASGHTERAATLAGLSIGQVSELGLVLVIQAYAAVTVGQAMFDGVILGAAAAMVASSYLKQREEAVYHHVRGREDTRPSVDLSGHVVVVGADWPGRRAARRLAANNWDVVVVDNDEERLEWIDATDRFITGVHGDVLTDGVLDRVRAEQAALIVSTALQKRVSEAILDVDGPARIVYSPSRDDAMALYERGAEYVLVPDLAVSSFLDEWLSSDLTAEQVSLLTEEGKEQLRETYDDELGSTGRS